MGVCKVWITDKFQGLEWLIRVCGPFCVLEMNLRDRSSGGWSYVGVSEVRTAEKFQGPEG